MHCRHCGRQTHFRKRRLDHELHFSLTIFTLGLWAIGWLAVIITWMINEPWRCQICLHRWRRSESTLLPETDSVDETYVHYPEHASH